MKFRVVEMCRTRCHVVGISMPMGFVEAYTWAAIRRSYFLGRDVPIVVAVNTPSLDAAAEQLWALMNPKNQKHHFSECAPVFLDFPRIAGSDQYRLN